MSDKATEHNKRNAEDAENVKDIEEDTEYDKEIKKMVKDIRLKLIELARLRTTWSYSQLNDQLELGLNFANILDRDLIGEWLGEVSIHEYNAGRPLLSCLITHQNGQREQGDGFYKLCAGIFGDTWEDLKADKKWENQLIADCFEYWLTPGNFRDFKNDHP